MIILVNHLLRVQFYMSFSFYFTVQCVSNQDTHYQGSVVSAKYKHFTVAF